MTKNVKTSERHTTRRTVGTGQSYDEETNLNIDQSGHDAQNFVPKSETDRFACATTSASDDHLAAYLFDYFISALESPFIASTQSNAMKSLLMCTKLKLKSPTTFRLGRIVPSSHVVPPLSCVAMKRRRSEK